MDIKQLSYFIQIAIDESYSIAAKKLYISQPALSKVVKNLEQELNIKLLYPMGRKTKLTDEGRLFLEKAKKLVNDFNELLGTQYDGVQIESGHVSIGVPPIVASCYLVDLVMAFQKQYPNITIDLVEKGTRALEQDVFLGTLDLACVMSPTDNELFCSSALIHHKTVLLVNRDHHLASKKSVTMDDLRDECFVIFDEEFKLHQKIIAACRESGFEPNVAVTSSQWDFLVELVSQNYGVSILPLPILLKYQQPKIVKIPIDHNVSVWDIIVIYRKDRYLSSACKRFLEFLTANIKTFEADSQA